MLIFKYWLKLTEYMMTLWDEFQLAIKYLSTASKWILPCNMTNVWIKECWGVTIMILTTHWTQMTGASKVWAGDMTDIEELMGNCLQLLHTAHCTAAQLTLTHFVQTNKDLWIWPYLNSMHVRQFHQFHFKLQLTAFVISWYHHIITLDQAEWVRTQLNLWRTQYDHSYIWYSPR